MSTQVLISDVGIISTFHYSSTHILSSHVRLYVLRILLKYNYSLFIYSLATAHAALIMVQKKCFHTLQCWLWTNIYQVGGTEDSIMQ